MPRVFFLPSHVSVDVEPGETILDAARKAAITLESPCDGTGTCGKCKVTLPGRNIEALPVDGTGKVSAEEQAAGVVLACQTRVWGETIVEIAAEWQNKSVKVLETGVSAAIEVDPFVRKAFLAATRTTAVYGGLRLLGCEAGDTRERLFGAVIDIGTTTLVATLVDLNDGREVATASALNPQTLHGQDVLSRIRLASEKDGLALLYNLFIMEADRLIGEICAQAGADRRNIYEIVYSGNTAMLHLATNTDPSHLGRYPYTPALRGGHYLGIPHEGGLHIAGHGVIYLPPIISGFVGADITSGVLATRLHERKGITLFIDIGTNGEMVIARDGFLTASSTAAGPAFEGMNITFGMRAGDGAIESFEVNGGGEPAIGGIGGGPWTGICGSGLLDVVGELVAHHVIDGSGRLAHPNHGSLARALGQRLVLRSGKPVFRLSDTIYLSQGDVRQVQLAKGAIRTGIEYLLRHTGVGPAEVDEVLIAGAFGFHLREKNLLAIGLLPEPFRGKVNFVGNTSKTGGVAFLLNKGYRAEMEKVVEAVQTIELANYKDFDRTFVNFLRF